MWSSSGPSQAYSYASPGPGNHPIIQTNGLPPGPFSPMNSTNNYSNQVSPSINSNNNAFPSFYNPLSSGLASLSALLNPAHFHHVNNFSLSPAAISKYISVFCE